MNLLSKLIRTGKHVAKGTAQKHLGVQSPQLGTSLVRIGRFLYTASLGWIAVSWYTAYCNEHTTEGEMKFIIPGAGGKVISAPDRKDKSLNEIIGVKSGETLGENLLSETAKAAGEALGISYGQTAPSSTGAAKGRKLIPLTPSQLGTPGTAVAGYLWSAPDNEKQKPAYNSVTYREITEIAASLGHKFSLKLTSGYRPNSSGSLHQSGLAWDMVGSMTDMKRAAVWAAERPGAFQEIFIHNEGSGIHLHLAMYPDAKSVLTTGTKYSESRTGPAPPQTASRALIV